MIQNLVRLAVQEMIPYQIQSEEQEVQVILDGNENPYPIPDSIIEQITQRLHQLELNRYPDPGCISLCQKIAEYLKNDICPEQIIVGNGSDEILQYLMQTFIQPRDRVLTLTPTFSMYKIFAQLAGGVCHGVTINEGGELNLQQFWEQIKLFKPKMIILCSPNNPTGSSLPLQMIAEIANRFSGVLVVDEAYAEFSRQSAISIVRDYPNLVITRTFSKALGVAGVRLGYMIANHSLKQEVAKVVPPYNVNSISQMVGELILDNSNLLRKRIEAIIEERDRLYELIKSYSGWKVLPSDANFLFVQGDVVKVLVEELFRHGIKVRRFTGVLADAIRITVGTPEENELVSRVIKIVGAQTERGRLNGA